MNRGLERVMRPMKPEEKHDKANDLWTTNRH